MKKRILTAIAIYLLPTEVVAMQAADVVGTGSHVDPVTLKESVAFLIKQEGRTLTIGCNNRGSGEVSIYIEPRYDETPVTSGMGYNKYRFGKMPKAASSPWEADGEVLRYDDAKFGASKAKAKFLDAMASDTVLHLRFDTYDGQAVSASFEYGGEGARELWKMLHQCRPAKVMAELQKMGSVLAGEAMPEAPANHGSKISR
jgi:hypothetical protein